MTLFNEAIRTNEKQWHFIPNVIRSGIAGALYKARIFRNIEMMEMLLEQEDAD